MGTEPNRTNQGTECKGTAREAGTDTRREGDRREQYHTPIPRPGKQKGKTPEQNRDHPPPRGRMTDGKKEERGKEARREQTRTEQTRRQGKNEDTTRDDRKRSEGKPENSIVGKSADCLTLSFFHI